jgi:hypothetical protein
MAGVVFQAVRGSKNPPKPNRGKQNKVEPQPSTSSDSSSGPPPNGQLQNQEPISGTDSTFNQCVDSEDSGFDHEGNMSAIIKLFLI